MPTVEITAPGVVKVAFDLDSDDEDDTVQVDIDGEAAVGITPDGRVIVWNVDSGEHTVVWTPHEDEVT